MDVLQNAVWLYLGRSIKEIQHIEQLISWCKRNNVVKILLQVSPGDVYDDHYDKNNIFYNRRKIIKELINKCQDSGIEVHGMISTLLAISKNIEDLMIKGKDNFCVDYHGISNWDEPLGGCGFLYDPTSEHVKTALANFCCNILKTYDKLSGIHLDFIRYFYYDSVLDIDTKNAGHFIRLLSEGDPIKFETSNGSKTTYFIEKVDNLYMDPPIGKKLILRRRFYYCFCNRCLENFQKNNNIVIPAELKTTHQKAKWILENCADVWDSFRAEAIADVIRRIRMKIKSINDAYQLSAAVWYNSPYGNELRNEPFTPMSEYKNFGQEWWKWAEKGLVDFVCPMDYWLSPDNYKKIVMDQIERIKENVPIFFGLLRTKEYDISVEELDSYKDIVKNTNAKGVCYFHYDTWNEII